MKDWIGTEAAKIASRKKKHLVDVRARIHEAQFPMRLKGRMYEGQLLLTRHGV
jgi:hypothetical protein